MFHLSVFLAGAAALASSVRGVTLAERDNRSLYIYNKCVFPYSHRQVEKLMLGFSCGDKVMAHATFGDTQGTHRIYPLNSHTGTFADLPPNNIGIGKPTWDLGAGYGRS
jgi:hypothetical protein